MVKLLYMALKSHQLLLCRSLLRITKASLTYQQGQEPEKGVREYFYFVDHQGRLFLDDTKRKNFTSCFKDKKFLTFFFRRIKHNNTGRYDKDFPYWSDCGRERNFVRCDDHPIVYTHIAQKVQQEGATPEDHLCYGHAGDTLSVNFQPEKIVMGESGRVYHPAPEKAGSIGLISSKLAIEISQFFKFQKENEGLPSHFAWNDKTYELQTDWYYKALEENNKVKV